MGTIEIRQALPDELEEAGALTLRAYEEYRRHIPEPLWEPYARELADARERAAAGTVLVALLDGSLVGCATVLERDDEPAGTVFLRMLAVDPKLRGAGVGRTLMAAVIDEARRRVAHTLVWNTVSFMEPAKALYATLGYQPEPEVRPLGEGIFLLTYRLALE